MGKITSMSSAGKFTQDSHRVIPGGAHTNSKGDDQFPYNAPRYLEKGKGCHVWDEQDRQFIDWTMGLRTMALGYGVPEIQDAAIVQIYKGSNFGRPSFIETEAAIDLLSLYPHADMVKFAKNGSTVTTAAVKLARAYTGRDYVALCKDHPFFSYDDWFIGTTACNSGIPQRISELSLGFKYNDIASLEKLFDQYPNKISCVILEAATTEHPKDEFLHRVKSLCKQHGAVFILDEMITGFRWHLNGAQKYYNIEADLSTFGKAFGNGFAVSALIGKKELMELGGLRHDKRRVFLISTTHGAENHALAAARAAIKYYKEHDVISHIWKIGQYLTESMKKLIEELQMQDYFSFSGIACNPYYVCRDKNGEVSMTFRTLFLQEMIKEGVIINYVSPSYAHSEIIVDKTVQAARKALSVYKMALTDGIERYLMGSTIKPVFREFN